jgi:nicotinate phosphoribosyltransferase
VINIIEIHEGSKRRLFSNLKPPFLDFLLGYRFDPNEVTVTQNGTILSLGIEGYRY